MQAGFAEADITPPVGTRKIGWLKEIVGTEVLDPLFARAAAFADGPERAGFLQLDLLSIRWSQVRAIRERIRAETGFPGERIMVAATHNHAGPAVANVGDVPRDEAYLATLVERSAAAFAAALDRLEDVELGFGSGLEPDLSFNRRMIMRDGTVKTQRSLSPEALGPEGPADPEVGLLAVRGLDRTLKGCLVNFACHPVHHGGDERFSAGFPGVLAERMRQRGCPVTLFLNGASGNLIANDPLHPGVSHTMETLGNRLADRVTLLLADLPWRKTARLSAASRTLALPFRDPTEAEVRGAVRGAQRFIDPAIYDRDMPALLERIRTRKTNPAEVQVLAMDEYAWVGIPAEYFVEHGLRIKEEAYPAHAWVVGHANGMLGYVPTRQAFRRGGYETTFAGSSRMAPETGDLLADAAIELIRKAAQPPSPKA